MSPAAPPAQRRQSRFVATILAAVMLGMLGVTWATQRSFQELLRPELQHYGGLSGVVHAGIAALVVWVLATGRTRAQRVVGAAVALGFVAKLLSETPWGSTLRQPEGWDITVAPLVHTTGAIAGALCALVAIATLRFSRSA